MLSRQLLMVTGARHDNISTGSGKGRRFAYSHTRDRLGDSDIRAPAYFDLASDQLSLASDRASICLFLRRDIEPGNDAAIKMDRARGSFTLDTPRTAGGFAPDGARFLYEIVRTVKQ